MGILVYEEHHRVACCIQCRNRQTIYRAWIGLFLFLAGSGVPNKIGNEPDPNHVAANIPMLFINFVLTQGELSSELFLPFPVGLFWHSAKACKRWTYTSIFGESGTGGQ